MSTVGPAGSIFWYTTMFRRSFVPMGVHFDNGETQVWGQRRVDNGSNVPDEESSLMVQRARMLKEHVVCQRELRLVSISWRPLQQRRELTGIVSGGEDASVGKISRGGRKAPKITTLA